MDYKKELERCCKILHDSRLCSYNCLTCRIRKELHKQSNNNAAVEIIYTSKIIDLTNCILREAISELKFFDVARIEVFGKRVFAVVN